VPTTDHEDRLLVSHSYTFATLEELGSALKYWTSRLLTITLNAKLTNDAPRTDAAAFEEQKDVVQQQDRLVANILMCWQQAYDNRPGGTVYMTVGFLSIWAALRDRETFRGQSVTYLGHRLCHHLTRAHGGAGAGQTLERLDLTAVVLIGGPLPSLRLPRQDEASQEGRPGRQTADKDMHNWLTKFVVACATQTSDKRSISP
jgi:hypothetical protein